MLRIRLSKTECERLAKGDKVVKGMLAARDLGNLSPGSSIQLTGCDFTCRVSAVRRYPDYRTLVLNEGLQSVKPEFTTIAEAVKALSGRHAEEDIAKSGVLALMLERSRF
jgi:ASC-1-like (ASCH) protein